MRYVGRLSECIQRLRAWAEEHDAKRSREGKAPDELLFEVRPWRSKRSLDQNAYYWALLGRLGQALGYPSDELHRHMLREYGVYDVFTVREDVPLADYFRYWDVVGSGQMDGVRYSHVRAFKGSSEMDRAEFGKLLDGVVQECRQQGIETRTPEEIARMKWIEGEE